ncbi:MAG: carboxymuconolactone decarboxylase family protein [Candidatus Omnitrophota bacterium]|nr:carboxymuconolactone decarboxylase family protein [Candidatus Omnitrophota bacterium]
MVRIKPLKKEEAQAETKAIFEGIEKNFGMIPNLFATIAHYPKALKPIIDLYQAIAKESTIEPRLQELANLEVSIINRCNYCLVHHSQMAKMAGVSDEQLNILRRGETVQDFTEKEKTVIEYARQVTKDAEEVKENLFERLRSYFNDSQIVNLTLIIGLMNVFNRFNGALGVELEK